MVIMVGERVNDPHLSNERVARWRRVWKEGPVRGILNAPAMVRGNTRERLLDITCLKPRKVRVVNLLPPSNECGRWDKRFAEYCAVHLLTWLARGDHDWERIFMLGKRLSCELTDRRRCEFGEVYDLCGVPALCFPHPSGRSRWLNGLEYQAKARLWARKFMRGIK